MLHIFILPCHFLHVYFYGLFLASGKFSHFDIDVGRKRRNIPNIIEILLVKPFSNAKLERMFSKMARVKSDWRNWLSQDHLDVLRSICKEGPSCKKFDSSPSIKKSFETSNVYSTTDIVFAQISGKTKET